MKDSLCKLLRSTESFPSFLLGAPGSRNPGYCSSFLLGSLVTDGAVEQALSERAGTWLEERPRGAQELPEPEGFLASSERISVLWTMRRTQDDRKAPPSGA